MLSKAESSTYLAALLAAMNTSVMEGRLKYVGFGESMKGVGFTVTMLRPDSDKQFAAGADQYVTLLSLVMLLERHPGCVPPDLLVQAMLYVGWKPEQDNIVSHPF